MFHKEEWGTVCDNSWDFAAANVVCRQLGCGMAVAAPRQARFGEGQGRIWLDDTRCTGTEAALSECRTKDWGVHLCQHKDDASVVCSGNHRLSQGQEHCGQSHCGPSRGGGSSPPAPMGARACDAAWRAPCFEVSPSWSLLVEAVEILEAEDNKWLAVTIAKNVVSNMLWVVDVYQRPRPVALATNHPHRSHLLLQSGAERSTSGSSPTVVRETLDHLWYIVGGPCDAQSSLRDNLPTLLLFPNSD